MLTIIERGSSEPITWPRQGKCQVCRTVVRAELEDCTTHQDVTRPPPNTWWMAPCPHCGNNVLMLDVGQEWRDRQQTRGLTLDEVAGLFKAQGVRAATKQKSAFWIGIQIALLWLVMGILACLLLRDYNNTYNENRQLRERVHVLEEAPHEP